jgi:hypothetical protein
LDEGAPKIVFCIIYKPNIDQFKISQVGIADNAYMSVLHQKLKDLMVETGKDFYMPAAFCTHETVQQNFIDGYADNSIPDIWTSVGIEMKVVGDIIEFKVI